VTARALRVLGAADVASGAIALVAASWFAEELDVGVTAVRVVAAALVVLGIETISMADRPLMAKVSVAVEALAAVLAVDLLLTGDPTGTGTVVLAATALWCAAAAIEVAVLQRTRALAPA
jgi:hypothetical protein